MSCVEKQLILSKLPLPTDVLPLIKDYCFFDRVSKTKEKKQHLLNMIRFTKCTHGYHVVFPYINETPRQKQLYIGQIKLCQTTILLVGICLDCGNYKKKGYTRQIYSRSTLCKCHGDHAFPDYGEHIYVIAYLLF